MHAIELRNIGKSYILKFEKGAIVKDVIPRLFVPKIEREFWALKGINLTVEKGECLGIIGDNGSGKTTLLSIIAKTTYPTEGFVDINGRVSTLLTLGAGFHMDLSGVDNIFLNGIILGMRFEEIKEKLSRIIAFSELKEFINQPFYTYSAGMMLRLGFSVAIHVDFDILLIDEILSVGDANFQAKCINKIKEFKEQGKTLLMASQSMEQISGLCDEVILLERGEILKAGGPTKVISFYEEKLKKSKKILPLEEKKKDYILDRNYPLEGEKVKICWGEKHGNKKAEIVNVKLVNEDGIEKRFFKTGECLKIIVDYKLKQKILNPHFGIAIFRDDYLYCYGPNTDFDRIRIKKLNPTEGEFSIEYKNLILGDGNYKISVAIWDEKEQDPYDYHCAWYKFKVKNLKRINGLIALPHYWLTDKRQKQRGDLLCESINNWMNSQQELKERNGKLLRFRGVKLTDKGSKPRFWYTTGERADVKIDLETLNSARPFIISAYLFRRDGILCHQTGLLTDNELNKDNNNLVNLSLCYEKLPLLRGDYYIVLITAPSEHSRDKDLENFISLRMVNFKVYTDKKDHGIVYLEHKWNMHE